MPACTNAPKLLYTLLALLAPVSFSRPGLRKVFALGAQPRDAGLPVWRPGAVRGEPSPRRDGGRGGSGWDGDGDPAARGGSRQGTARSPVRGTAPASPGRLQQPRGTQRSQPPHGHAYRCGGQRLSLWLGGGGVCSSCCTSAEALPSACLQQPGATTQPCAPAPASPPQLQPPPDVAQGGGGSSLPPAQSPPRRSPLPTPAPCSRTAQRIPHKLPLSRYQKALVPAGAVRGAPPGAPPAVPEGAAGPHGGCTARAVPVPLRTALARPPCVRRVVHLPLVQSPTVFIFVDLFGLKSCLAIILNK